MGLSYCLNKVPLSLSLSLLLNLFCSFKSEQQQGYSTFLAILRNSMKILLYKGEKIKIQMI